MFDFVDQLIHGRSGPEQQAARVLHDASVLKSVQLGVNASGGKRAIAYNRNLVNSLETQNESLIEGFAGAYGDGFEQGNFTILCEQLGQFKASFQNHLITENVKIFCYLEQSQKGHPSTLASLRESRKEIKYWSNAVIKFCKKYEKPIDVYHNQDSFKNEFQAVGQALIHRVRMVEEEVYARYYKVS